MVKKEYSITGMTCNGCVQKIQKALNAQSAIENADIQFDYPQATIVSKSDLNLREINQIIQSIGNYAIHEERREPMPALPRTDKKHTAGANTAALPARSMGVYYPLILIVGFILLFSVLAQYPLQVFSWTLWMRHFMAGFFTVFSFFKMLNITGFAHAYKKYDIVCARWPAWGYLYPFVELALGIGYFINLAPPVINTATIVILGVSSIGVVESNLNRRKIKCACLGDVFNLPMSTVTIIEDLLMVLMAVVMLFYGT